MNRELQKIRFISSWRLIGRDLQLLILLFTLPAILQAQAESCTLTVTGRIIDEHDESPLSYSYIKLNEDGPTVMADDLGNFELNGVCPGVHTLHVSHVGCEPMQYEFRAVPNLSNHLIIRMEHHHELRELEVAGEQNAIKTGVNTLEFKEGHLDLKRMQKLGTALAELEGVSVIKSGPNISKPVINGVFGNRIAIFNDYSKLEDQQWGADHAPALELADAGEIIVVKGAQGVEFGPEALGGAIIAKPEPFEDHLPVTGTLRTGYASNGNGIFAGGRLSGALTRQNRLQYRVSGSWNKRGDSRTPEYFLNNTGSENFQVGGAVAYKYKTLKVSIMHTSLRQELGILTDAHNGNLTDLSEAVNLGTPATIEPFSYQIENPRQRVFHSTTGVSASIKPGSKSQLDFNYSFQQNNREEYDIRRGIYNEIPAVDLRLRTHSAKITFTGLLSDRANIKTGAEIRHMENLSNAEIASRPIVPNYFQQQAGAFALLSYNPGKWETEIGVRLDAVNIEAFKWYRTANWNQLYAGIFDDFVQSYNESANQVFTRPEFSYFNVSAAAGVRYFLNDDTYTGFRISHASRPPNSAELFSEGLHLGAATVDYGNLLLKPEQGTGVEWYGQITKGKFRTLINLYGKLYSGFILPEFSGVELTIRGAFPQMTYRQTDALFYGVDARFIYQFSDDFKTISQLALTYAHDLQRNALLPNIPPPNMRNELSWSPLFRGTRDWNFSLITEHHLRQNNAPRVITVDELRLMTEAEIRSEQENGSFDIALPPGEYHLLHLQISRSFNIRGKKLLLGLLAENLLNRSYRSYLNRFRYFALEEGTNVQLMFQYKF